MSGKSDNLQMMSFEYFLDLIQIIFVFIGLFDVQMLSPAGKFDPVIAILFKFYS